MRSMRTCYEMASSLSIPRNRSLFNDENLIPFAKYYLLLHDCPTIREHLLWKSWINLNLKTERPEKSFSITQHGYSGAHFPFTSVLQLRNLVLITFWGLFFGQKKGEFYVCEFGEEFYWRPLDKREIVGAKKLNVWREFSKDPRRMCILDFAEIISQCVAILEIARTNDENGCGISGSPAVSSQPVVSSRKSDHSGQIVC